MAMAARLYSYNQMSDSLDLTAGKIAAASDALTLIAGRIESISVLVMSAQKSGADRLLIDQNLSVLQSEIVVAANAANFNGGNWFLPAKSPAGVLAARDDLDESDDDAFSSDAPGGEDGPLRLEYFPPGEDDDAGAASTIAWDGQFEDREGDSKQGVAGAGALGLMGLEGLYSLSKPSALESDFLSFNTSGATDSDLWDMMQSLADALSGLNTAQTFLGYLSASYDGRCSHDFVFGAGVRSLVNVDLDEDSTRIVALETQQQLGVQSLSIANDNASIILKLLG
jgi:flagellin